MLLHGIQADGIHRVFPKRVCGGLISQTQPEHLLVQSEGTGRFTMLTSGNNSMIVVSALRARASLGRLLRRVEDERRSLVIEKRGAPQGSAA